MLAAESVFPPGIAEIRLAHYNKNMLLFTQGGMPPAIIDRKRVIPWKVPPGFSLYS